MAFRPDLGIGARLLSLLTRRRLVVVTAACAAAGLFLAGAATGWWAADQFSPRSAPQVSVVAASTGDGEADGAPSQVVMPDVRGLTEADARQVLSDLGLAGVTVIVASQPSVATSGTVVAQDPVASAPLARTVMLTLAAPAVVPDLVGIAVTEAIRQVEDLGARVRVVRTFAPEAGMDEVIAVEPPPGEPVTGNEVVLTVSTPASEATLTQLRPIEGGCRTVADVQVDGVVYHDALRCDRLRASGHTIVYLLNRGVTEFTATVGQDDASEPGEQVRVEVLVDEVVVSTSVLAWGESERVSADTDEGLRLTLRITPVGDDVDNRAPVVVFAEPTLRGGPDAIQALLAGA